MNVHEMKEPSLWFEVIRDPSPLIVSLSNTHLPRVISALHKSSAK